MDVCGRKNYSEFDRLATFTTWNSYNWYLAHPLDLARWGFVYQGQGTKVKCVFCNLIVANWNHGDSVKDKHFRLSPNCPLLTGQTDLNLPWSQPLVQKDVASHRCTCWCCIRYGDQRP